MAEYMGYEGLGKSQRVGVRGAARLAEDHGYEYEIFDDGKIKIITPDGSRTFGANVKAGALGKFFGYAEGGMVKPVAKQMELFDEGGLLDEGGTVDEESGNDVPVGSLKKEVRDDVPAQLSEGEFVMPADVVRFHGLDKMMALRDEAKMGLARMEAMGQMGNADEATLPDGVPFGMADLVIVDSDTDKEYNTSQEFSQGGVVYASNGADVQGANVPGQGFPSIPPFGGYPQQPPYGVVQPPAAPFAPFGPNVYSVPSQFQQPVFGPFQPPYATGPAAAPVTPVYGPGQPTGEPKETFTFDEMQPTVGGTSETREYRNEDGESLYIPFINGEPIYPIPAGYTPYVPEAADPVDTDPAPVVGQSRERVLTQDELRDRDDADKAREQALIDQYGNANARIGLSNFLPGGEDITYGVNIISGMGKLGSLNFLKDEIPKDAEIMLKNGNDEIILTGEEYNRLRDNIRKSGKRGNLSPSQYNDYDTSREDFERGRARVGERASAAFFQSIGGADEAEDPSPADKTKDTPLTDKQMNLLLKSYTGVTDYGVGGDDGFDFVADAANRERGRSAAAQRATAQAKAIEAQAKADAAAARIESSNQTVQDIVQSITSDDDGTSNYGTEYSIDDGYSDYAASDDFSEDVDYYDYGFQQGGLVGKKKPKAKKKMKQGGLASKK